MFPQSEFKALQMVIKELGVDPISPGLDSWAAVAQPHQSGAESKHSSEAGGG